MIGWGEMAWRLSVTKTLPTVRDESVIWTGEERWIVGWKRKKEHRKCRERDCKMSPTAVPWKVPERAHTSPASLFFTRQAVLGTFSRSVASASCQSKQRACFVKPKVKLRSNEGTALAGGTSSIILPQLPAECSLYVKHSAAHRHRRWMESCRGLSCYFQICRCMSLSMPHVW